VLKVCSPIFISGFLVLYTFYLFLVLVCSLYVACDINIFKSYLIHPYFTATTPGILLFSRRHVSSESQEKFLRSVRAVQKKVEDTLTDYRAVHKVIAETLQEHRDYMKRHRKDLRAQHLHHSKLLEIATLDNRIGSARTNKRRQQRKGVEGNLIYFFFLFLCTKIVSTLLSFIIIFFLS